MIVRRFFRLAAVGCLVVWPIAECAAQSRSVVHDKTGDWLAGQLRGVQVTDNGLLLPGMIFTEQGRPEIEGVETVWCALPMPDGAVLLGTGPEGKVLRVENNGAVKELAKLEESHVFALARASDGMIFATASPGGSVYLLETEGVPEKWFGGEAQYVWALLWHRDALWAATGNPAKIVKILKQGEFETVVEVPDTHARTMAADGADLVIGTAGRGLVLRWGESTGLLALHTAERSEVRQVEVLSRGEVVFSVLGERKSGLDSGAGSGPASRASRPRGDSSASGGASSQRNEDRFDVFTSLGGERESGSSMPGALPDIRGEIMRLKSGGEVMRIMAVPGQPHYFVISGGDVFVGAGSRGFVFRASLEGDLSAAVAQLPGSHVTALWSVGKSVRAACSFPVGWGLLETSTEPVFQSSVIDAGWESQWGALNILGSAEGVSVRFGGTPEPDALWGKWLEWDKPSVGSGTTSRFMQYRLRPGSDGVRRVEVFYQPRNRAPVFRDLKVLESGELFQAVESSPSGPSPQNVEQLLRSAGAGAAESSSKSGSDGTRIISTGGRSARTLVFSVDDPEGNDLQYAISYRSAGGSEFTLLKEGLEKPFFSFDTRGWRDGWYEFRVTATDKPMLGQLPLSAERVTLPVLVDNTPPTIEMLQATNDAVTFRVADYASVITVVEVSFDGLNFTAALPEDGVLDSLEENFRVSPPKGCKALHVRASDRAGNLTGAYVELP